MEERVWSMYTVLKCTNKCNHMPIRCVFNSHVLLLIIQIAMNTFCTTNSGYNFPVVIYSL